MTERWITYSKLDYDRDEPYPPVFYGADPSAELQGIAAQTGTDYDLGNGKVYRQCSEYRLMRALFKTTADSESLDAVLPDVNRSMFSFSCGLCQLVRDPLRHREPSDIPRENEAGNHASDSHLLNGCRTAI
jgi:hypothetical protein